MSLKSATGANVIYATVPPNTGLVGQLWQDISTVPGKLWECVNLSPLTYAVVGPGGGGAGTVTSVTAGDGLAASPNPIVGAGTVSLQNRFADSLLLMGA